MITDERLDELIFDYLEGNLSAEEREAVEILKAENETFNAQVMQWKNTYVSEPLPLVDDLQRKLLIPSGNNGTARILHSLGLLLLLVFLPGDGLNSIRQVQSAEKMRNADDEKNIVSAVAPLEVNTPVPACERLEDKIVSLQAREVAAPAHLSSISDAEDFEILTDKNPLPALSVEMPDVRQIEIMRVTVPPVSAVKTGETKKLSKKQIRALRVHKRNSRRKSTIEFQPGNVPYVVPLDGKNF